MQASPDFHVSWNTKGVELFRYHVADEALLPPCDRDVALGVSKNLSLFLQFARFCMWSEHVLVWLKLGGEIKYEELQARIVLCVNTL